MAGGVFVRHYRPMAITICVVQGRNGLLLVDTRASPAEAAELRTDLQELGAPLRWVVNTHAHFDHTFGNQHFGPGSAANLPLYGHQRLPAHLDEYERPRLAAWRAGTGQEPHGTGTTSSSLRPHIWSTTAAGLTSAAAPSSLYRWRRGIPTTIWSSTFPASAAASTVAPGSLVTS